MEAWMLTTHVTIKNCFVNCSFCIDHVSSCDNSAVKVKGWLTQCTVSEVLFEEYKMCNNDNVSGEVC